jgi:predicted RNA-binding Zn-ribbon protein involved in translation (DUF1610 family)
MFAKLDALPDEEIVHGKVRACDHCGEAQIFGCSYVIKIAWSTYELCDDCVYELVHEMKRAVG